MTTKTETLLSLPASSLRPGDRIISTDYNGYVDTFNVQREVELKPFAVGTVVRNVGVPDAIFFRTNSGKWINRYGGDTMSKDEFFRAQLDARDPDDRYIVVFDPDA